MRYVPEWARSLFFGHNPLDDAVPWLPFKARAWLQEHVDQETAVFEYGSGGSTLFLARTAGRVLSVEHDAAWFALVARALAQTGAGSCEHRLHEPRLVAGELDGLDPYRSRRPEFAGQTFERYVKSIDPCPDRSLDLVIVDGRARLACIERCLPKIREGGHLLLDNSERGEYAPAYSRLAGYDRVDLEGLAPYRMYTWRTSVWQITQRR